MPIARLDLSVTEPAPTPRKPFTRRAHGIEFPDDWAWLRADNWREVLKRPELLPSEIREVLEAENIYAEATLAPTKALRAALVKEMRARVKEDDSDPPYPDGAFEYFDRFREGGEHELVCRRPRGGGVEQVMLDGDRLAEGKDFFEIGSATPSPDHRLLAWSVDDKGSEYYSIRVRDLASGKDLPDSIPDTEGEMVWTADSSAFYYVRLDENHRPTRVYRHVLGEDPADDVLVLEEKDSAWFVHIHQTKSRRFLTIEITDHDSAEVWLADLHDPVAQPRVVEPRQRGIRYSVSHREDQLFIRTNADAEDFRIVEAPLAMPGRDQWRDLVPHRQGRMIVAISVGAAHLVRLEREDSLPRIVIRDIASGEEYPIAFDEEAYALSVDEILEYDKPVLRFNYSSMTTPRETWDFDMVSRARELRKRQEIPSGHNPADYVTRRVLAKATDGEMVPVSLLYRRDAKLDGSEPLFLTAYGAYGHATSASFGSRRLSLVDRGFIFAIAHVRGGTDKGWRWYTDGKLAKKPNTFTDFIAVARDLVARGVTVPGRIVASGGSAGGMLMGAIANLAPELFAGVIADVPFVDVINTMMDADLPLTPPEWLEWGNPIEDAAAFATMMAYSPYDNVRATKYPAILALAGLTDPRVTYWEPAKWVARLRATKTGGGPILLKTNMAAGHGGASGRFDSLNESALEYAFALACVGLDETPRDHGS